MHPRPLRGSPSPFACDNLKILSVVLRSSDDRLQKPFVPNRPGKILEIFLLENLAWIIGIGVQKFDRNLPKRTSIQPRRFLAWLIADERRQSTAKTPLRRLLRHHVHSFPSPIPQGRPAPVMPPAGAAPGG